MKVAVQSAKIMPHEAVHNNSNNKNNLSTSTKSTSPVTLSSNPLTIPSTKSLSVSPGRYTSQSISPNMLPPPYSDNNNTTSTSVPSLTIADMTTGTTENQNQGIASPRAPKIEIEKANGNLSFLVFFPFYSFIFFSLIFSLFSFRK